MDNSTIVIRGPFGTSKLTDEEFERAKAMVVAAEGQAEMEQSHHSVLLVPGQIHIWHLRRTGGHGVIDWLMGHHDGHKIHHNQAVPKAVALAHVPLGQSTLELGDPAKPPFEVVSFEDLPLDERAAQLVRPSRTILLLRDPFNTFASRLKRVRDNPVRNRLSAIEPDLWKQYAHEFLQPRYLTHAVRINFNRWYLSQDYRQTISEQLGWQFSDRGFGSKKGWTFSQGSSFGDADPLNLDVLNRWKTYQDDEEFRGYLDDEIRELSKRIFDLEIPFGSSPRLTSSVRGQWVATDHSRESQTTPSSGGKKT